MNVRMSEKTNSPEIKDLPVWCQPEAPLGSAVRYLASISPSIDWVCISKWKGRVLKPGPSIGSRSRQSRIRVTISDAAGKRLGRLEVGSARAKAFGSEEESRIRKIASELGNVWRE